MSSRSKHILELAKKQLENRKSGCNNFVGEPSTSRVLIQEDGIQSIRSELCMEEEKTYADLQNVSLQDYSPETSSDEYLPSSSDESSSNFDDEYMVWSSLPRNSTSNIGKAENRFPRREMVKKNLFQGPQSNEECRDVYVDITTQNQNTENIATQQSSTCEVIKKKIFELPEKTSKRRLRNPENWKRRKAAKFREKGESYVAQTGKVVPQKRPETDSLCKKRSCKLQCGSKFDIESRAAIFEKFYNLDVNAKNSLLFKSIIIQPVRRHRKNITKPKGFSFKYTVTFDQKVVTVCKTALCSLYQITPKKIQIIQRKLESGGAAPTPDKRGHHKIRPHKIPEDVSAAVESHISRFPAEQSHYSRNKNINKKYLSPLLNLSKMYELYIEECQVQNRSVKYKIKKCSYNNIFSTRFNLSFGQPRSDTCSTYDSGANTEEHRESYKFAFEQQKRDREHACSQNTICYATMDLQQTMPLPRLTTSKAFYLRQLWFYNQSVHAITATGEKSYFFTWTEDIASKGSLEIGSSLFTFTQLLVDGTTPIIEHLILWSDSCGGQNKNFNMIALYQYLVLKGVFKTIDHKFPVVGHSFLDSDRDFGRIEKMLRKTETVYLPDQYRDIIKSSSAKGSIVMNMKDHFQNLEEIAVHLKLINRTKNTLNEKVHFRDNVTWIRVQEYGSYLYKTCLDEYTPFMKVDILKSGHRKIQPDDYNLNHIANKTNQLTNDKISNLEDQIIFVKSPYKVFYNNIINQFKIQKPQEPGKKSTKKSNR